MLCLLLVSSAPLSRRRTLTVRTCTILQHGVSVEISISHIPVLILLCHLLRSHVDTRVFLNLKFQSPSIPTILIRDLLLPRAEALCKYSKSLMRPFAEPNLAPLVRRCRIPVAHVMTETYSLGQQLPIYAVITGRSRQQQQPLLPQTPQLHQQHLQCLCHLLSR